MWFVTHYHRTRGIRRLAVPGTMWITFSLFLIYSTFLPQYNVRIVLTMTRAFWWYPISQGSIGLKWFGLSPSNNQCYVNLHICLTIYSNKYKYWSQTTNFSIVITFFSSLSKTHNWHHNHHNHGRHQRKIGPLGWEFQFSVPISGTPVGSRFPILFLIPDIPVDFFFEFCCWKVIKSEFRFQNLEFRILFYVGTQYISFCMRHTLQ